MWALSLKCKDKLYKSNLREGSSFPHVVLTEREKRERMRVFKTSLFNLRSSIDRNSLDKEQKIIYSTRAMRKY